MDDAFDSSRSLDKAQLKALSARSDAKGFAQLLGHCAALTATTALVAWAFGSFWLFPTLVLHGLVLTFLFAPLHETIHRTAFRSRWLNDAVAQACGFPLVLPANYFRLFHFAHHRYTQDEARDPELAASKPQSLGAYAWHVTGLPYWRERVGTTIKHATGTVDETFVAPHQRKTIVTEARLHLALYGALGGLSLAFTDPVLLYFWVVPALLGQPFLRLYLLAEHTGCPLVPDMLRNSRTTRSNALVRWLAWNMPHHAEHHAYPALPFHALPKAHGVLRDHIAIRATGYFAVHREILRNLKCPKAPSVGS